MPYLSLLVGVFACSTAAVLIKLSTVDPVLLTGLRLLVAVAVLAPWAWRDWRRRRDEFHWGHLRDVLLPGVVLAAHLVTWNLGVRMTLATNGSLIVNTTPLATPFLLAMLMGERVTRREIEATLIALVGMAWLFVVDFRLSPETFRGDLVCFGSMLLVATYLVLGRKFRHHPTTLLYVTPLYGVASLAAFASAPLCADLSPIDWGREWVWVVLLGLVPTIVGHSLVNRAMRQMRGQVVSILNLGQFLFAGALAWAVLGERPVSGFYPAAALIVGAAVWAVTERAARRTPQEPAPNGR